MALIRSSKKVDSIPSTLVINAYGAGATSLSLAKEVASFYSTMTSDTAGQIILDNAVSVAIAANTPVDITALSYNTQIGVTIPTSGNYNLTFSK